MSALSSLPPLPLGIRVLRDAVIVVACIAAGQLLGRLPYGAAPPDPLMVETFMAVLGTLGFALCAFLARSRRALHLLLTALAVWLFAGFLVARGGGSPVWWVFRLVVIAAMALLGGGLARLIERLARD